MTTLSITLSVEIRDLRDPAELGWLTTARDRRLIAEDLRRTPPEDADFLVACLPSGQAVGKVRISYERRPGAGLLWQFDVVEPLRSHGIGSALVTASEERIRARGLDRAELGVEETNPQARALYERHGYVAYGTAPESWDHELPDGTLTRYETVCVLLRKQLDPANAGT